MADLMISYAQNHEDVLLDRLFPRDHKGLYIDVGANDPLACSVTKHFYELGWSGINVEPSRVFDKLAAQRTRDVNLPVAVSDEDGEATFYEFSGKHSTDSTLDTSVASGNDRFAELCTPRKVQVQSLRTICAKHVGSRAIDFLSIDVEGHEEKVIRGADWKTYRPRVVLVESTRPHSRLLGDLGWERHLLTADYLFATFDGVNRYYVRAEDRDFLDLLSTPVCIFDEYFSVVQYIRRYNKLQETGMPPEVDRMVKETLAVATPVEILWWLLRHRLRECFPSANRLFNGAQRLGRKFTRTRKAG